MTSPFEFLVDLQLRCTVSAVEFFDQRRKNIIFLDLFDDLRHVLRIVSEHILAKCGGSGCGVACKLMRKRSIPVDACENTTLPEPICAAKGPAFFRIYELHVREIRTDRHDLARFGVIGMAAFRDRAVLFD